MKIFKGLLELITGVVLLCFGLAETNAALAFTMGFGSAVWLVNSILTVILDK